MKIWNQVRSALRNWLPTRSENDPSADELSEQQRLAASLNLKSLLEDTSIPSAVRAELANEFRQIEEISQKLQRQEIHVAAFGRVGVGKSSLLNALLGEPAFSTSALHGETRSENRISWSVMNSGQLLLVDSPGIDELDGQQREQLAREVSNRADVVLMVCDSDLTQLEMDALTELSSRGRTLILVLNKADRYTSSELDQLIERLQQRTQGLIPAGNILACSSNPRPETVIRQLADGREVEEQRNKPANVEALKSMLWNLLEKDGKSLAVLNASLFTRELDQKISSRIVEIRKNLADKLIQKYCLAKGLAVAVNPIPVADLLAAAGTDIAMITHLGEVYGFRMEKREASRLLLTISAQWIALMGAYWGVNLVSSALKTVSAGMSTVLTASAQGALAWYATSLTGKMAQSWFSRGKSWGATGPREVANEVLASMDRSEVIEKSMQEIRRLLDAR